MCYFVKSVNSFTRRDRVDHRTRTSIQQNAGPLALRRIAAHRFRRLEDCCGIEFEKLPALYRIYSYAFRRLRTGMPFLAEQNDGALECLAKPYLLRINEHDPAELLTEVGAQGLRVSHVDELGRQHHGQSAARPKKCGRRKNERDP